MTHSFEENFSAKTVTHGFEENFSAETVTHGFEENFLAETVTHSFKVVLQIKNSDGFVKNLNGAIWHKLPYKVPCSEIIVPHN